MYIGATLQHISIGLYIFVVSVFCTTYVLYLADYNSQTNFYNKKCLIHVKGFWLLTESAMFGPLRAKD